MPSYCLLPGCIIFFCGFLRSALQRIRQYSVYFIGVVRRVGLPVVLKFIFSFREGKEHKRNVAFGSRD
jgi:hypothetical protein